MKRSLRPWWLALAASLLLHGVLIGGLRGSLPQETFVEPSPFEARLVSVAVPDVMPPQPVALAPAPKPVVRAPPVSTAHSPALPIQPVAVASGRQVETALSESAAIVEAVPVAQHEPMPVAPDMPTPAALPPLNPLPPRIDLRFQVHYGLASGEQTMVWVNEGGQRYTAISVASATGLAGVFYRGQFVQTSRGRITPHGLQPEEFRDQRGDKRSTAQFDAAQGQLTLNPAKGAPRHFTYPGEAQDVLSLFFHLALTAPPPESRLTYTVFNGKKLRDYTYVVRGETVIETAVGSLRALHLARATDGDGRFEVWLAIDRHYLPVRVLRSDDKGNEVELRIQSIAP